MADFILPDSTTKLVEQVKNINIYFSKDDPIVPPIDFIKYQKFIPAARFIEFTDRGHFLQPTFPELIQDLKLLINK
ncbi:MAG: hypothetical protein COX77_01900 [Candidatus Komeilibacteria bacterium CG_4_10_14_0_2_um_filter_37_10]|uniref:Alpha/beta hydrolase n=1 Tax=Candidatus Komeilibacteria bacterium CG_4_10_14_0_2_um_filter_37_10 TaxID=1974470 RepID=A0A2M7VFF8_9BACT|nr:MAG: hypothetical protein COX77_01900 [Candidatus Komeilibacteria bacterium CG_4_10_14_0_2_um_filter_37_10]PJA94300.1 MAG: hypothetical protein CO133_00155 [Candidatus Komeilibacteria bacterium CG_4_9_14_3_um_filter_37_5]